MSDQVTPIKSIEDSGGVSARHTNRKDHGSDGSVHSDSFKARDEPAVAMDGAGGAPIKVNFFRSTFWNISVVGLCCFFSAGCWGAMSLLGAGGSQSPSLVNAANSSTFCLMVVTCILQPAIVRMTSIRFCLFVGMMGYPVYAAGLYLFSATGGQTSWLVVVGAIACGTGAGMLWATEGAIVLSYPERHNQGRYLSYFLCYRVLGQLIGGAITLGLNANAGSAGSISVQTYLVFVALQAVGPFFAWALSPPSKVQRTDGSPVLLYVKGTPWSAVKSLLGCLLRPKVALLLPMIWMSTFSEAITGTYNATYFSVRSRALGSFLAAILAMIANVLLGFFLDWQKFSINARAKIAFGITFGCAAGYWVYAIIVMNDLHGRATKPTLDWADGPQEWGRAFGVYLMLQIAFNTMYELNYWIVSGISDDPEDVIRLTSIIRGVESAGQAVSYGINSTPLRLDAIAGINLAQLLIAVIPAWFVVRKLGILADGTKIHQYAIYASSEDRNRLVQQGLASAAPDGRGDQIDTKTALQDKAIL